MKLTELFDATIARLNPAQLVAGALADLDWAPREVTIVAVGKAAVGMTAGAAAMLGDHLAGGVVVAPEAGDVPDGMELVLGAHPVPDERSVAAARALLGAVRDVPPGRDVLALISGGASALAAMPPEAVSLADKVATVSAVYASGAPIGELNTVRKHISALKGGRLARAAAGPVTTLVLSDVVGDNLADVGSGPTVPDPTTYANARAILRRRVGEAALPVSVRAHIDGEVDESPSEPRPGDRAVLVAGVGALADAAAAVARGMGFEAGVFSRELEGDVGDVAETVAEIALADTAGVFVASGEMTIELPDLPGTGGRAHHLALLIAKRIRGKLGVRVLVAGSDGIDGNTGAAGAVVDGTTWGAVVDGDGALASFDAGAALAAAGASFATGPTGVNHADLVVVYVE